MRFNRNYSLTVVVLFFIHCAPGFAQVVDSDTVTLPPAPIDSFPYSPLRQQKTPAGKKQEAIVEAPIDADYALPVAPKELVSTKLPRPNVMLPGAVRAPQWNFGRTLKLARIRPITNPGGWTNDCAQYAVAAVLSASGSNVDKVLYDHIGHFINPQQTGSPLEKINDYLKRHFDTKATWNANGNQLHDHINRGLPAVVTLETGPKSTHAVIVYGIETGPHGERLNWLIEDNGLLRGKMTNIQFLEKWKLPSKSRNANHCIFISPKPNSPKPPPLLAEIPHAPLIPTMTVEQRRSLAEAMVNTRSNSQELAKLKEQLAQFTVQIAAIEKPQEPQCPQPIEAPLVSSLAVEQTVAELTKELGQGRDEMHQLRAQFQHIKVELAELREAQIFTTPVSSQVVPDKLAAIEKVNEKHRQPTVHNTRQNESDFVPPRQSSVVHSPLLAEHSAPAQAAPSESKKPTLWEQFYTWRGNRIGIQIGEPVTTNPTFPETVSQRFEQAKQHLKSYCGSANFEAPATATVAIATLSSLIVLPLLFIVVHAINGKWLKM